jgi:hypothetical protein
MDSSKWCVVKRLDKFSRADVDASLANLQRNVQTPAIGRLVELSNMHHPECPEWSVSDTHTYTHFQPCVYCMLLLCFCSLLCLGFLFVSARRIEGRISLFTC